MSSTLYFVARNVMPKLNFQNGWTIYPRSVALNGSKCAFKITPLKSTVLIELLQDKSGKAGSLRIDGVSWTDITDVCDRIECPKDAKSIANCLDDLEDGWLDSNNRHITTN